MDTMKTDHLIDDYLRRLEHAAAHMQRAAAPSLSPRFVAASRRRRATSRPPAKRRYANVLDPLGPPEEIVEDAEPHPPSDAPACWRSCIPEGADRHRGSDQAERLGPLVIV
jgi:hypothetical protein